VLLSVENTGPAIDAAGMASLFDPCVEVLTAMRKPERTSLGLGLFIVRQIVHAHGGTVTLSSGDRKTVFKVKLPRKPLNSTGSTATAGGMVNA
jgi:signal transduction histidine kinase